MAPNPREEGIRPELQELFQYREAYGDARRPDAVERLHRRGQRTARENLADLFDPGSFREYGDLAVAAYRSLWTEAELYEKSPGDGIITGIGSVNGELVGEENSLCSTMVYDSTVFAGTQGFWGHKKMDRIAQLAHEMRLPMVIFARGSGGRPNVGDLEHFMISGTNSIIWGELGRLSGRAPLVAIVDSYCFAGNAAMAGCCECIIATRTMSLGMGGPVMVEGGGMGKCGPEEIGPADTQFRNGVADFLVEDEAEAVRVAKQYLRYFQQPRLTRWEAHDQTPLRDAMPARRQVVYNVRSIIETLADKDSVLELRAGFAPNIVTCLARVEGRSCGVVANSAMHLGGAIDAAGADKYSRFLQICNAFGYPVISLIDCPGFMVGPQAESEALVRHACRMYLNGAQLDVPMYSVFLRKVYGLGAVAMLMGNGLRNAFTVAWPTAEFGGMRFEGQVQLAHKHELEAIQDEEARKQRIQELAEEKYRLGRAIRAASILETDTVIDPMETRDWISTLLKAAPPWQPKEGRFIDGW